MTTATQIELASGTISGIALALLLTNQAWDRFAVALLVISIVSLLVCIKVSKR